MSRPLKRISYVEDEKDIRAIAELALSEVGGFEIDVSVDGTEAMDRIPAFDPDLILLDVMMPGMNGPEVFGLLKTMPKVGETPVVFMTAKAQKHEVESYLALGAAGVIPKPFDPMTLHERVREIWDREPASQEAT